jgi:exopolyphosphatase / guanosine-5'-triphosphate,3'-diphosphate pyrophosphatase
MEIKRYAAIDVGSNGVRLLISNVLLIKNQPPLFRKSALVRVPIRLGADTFESGKISEKNKIRMADAMKAFYLLMDVHGVEKYRACATSAMREASNSKEIIQYIKRESGVNIEIIDGKTEAAIISSTDIYQMLDMEKDYLYIDVGGGSTEFTMIRDGQKLASKSFKIGTVRLLDSKDDFSKEWTEAEKWIVQQTKNSDEVTVIGSGGNIVRVYKMANTGIGKPISLDYIKKQYKHLKSLTYEQRIVDEGLNPDRADVIIPALEIYISAMKWSNAKKVIVPKFGLADGIIKTLYAAGE